MGKLIKVRYTHDKIPTCSICEKNKSIIHCSTCKDVICEQCITNGKKCSCKPIRNTTYDYLWSDTHQNKILYDKIFRKAVREGRLYE